MPDWPADRLTSRGGLGRHHVREGPPVTAYDADVVAGAVDAAVSPL